MRHPLQIILTRNLQNKNGISKLGASHSTPDACAYFADYIRKLMRKDL